MSRLAPSPLALGLFAVATVTASGALASLEGPASASSAIALGEIRGQVVDRSGRPIAGATVAAGAISARSDATGAFVLGGVPPGPLDVFAYADGYLPITIPVAPEARALARIELSTELSEQAAAARSEVIVVSGQAPERARPIEYQLTPDQIRALPGSGNDALRAMQSLPGVGRVAYGLGGLVLRGAAPGDSKVYLDGIELPLAFHFGGLASVIPTTMLQGLSITPSGGDVAWGRSVGGTVELTSRAGRGDGWRACGELSVIDASAYGEGPTPGGGSLVASVRRSYFDAVMGAVMPDDYRVLARYYDSQLRWDQPVGRGALTALALYSDDVVSRGQYLDFAQRVVRAGLRYRRHVGATAVQALAWSGWSQLDLQGLEEKEDTSRDAPGMVSLHRQRVPVAARAEVRHATGWGDLGAGVDLRSTWQPLMAALIPHDADNDTVASPVSPMAWAHELAAWTDARVRLADGALTVKPGARVEHDSTTGEWLVEPRLVVSHQLAPWLVVRESVSRHHRPPTAALAPDGTPIGSSRGTQASLGLDVALPASFRVQLGGYHTWVAGPPSDGTTAPDLRDALGTGLGVAIDNLLAEEMGNDRGRFRARGAELLVERRSDRLLLWLAYTLAQAQRHTGAAHDAAWHVTDLDQTHNASAVASVTVGAWRLGARGRFASGFPRSWSDEQGRIHQYRLKDFLSLDLRAERAWRRSWGAVALFLDLSNATNYRTEEGIFVDNEGRPHRLTGLPILPSFGLAFTPG